MEESFSRYADRVAYSFMGKDVSYAADRPGEPQARRLPAGPGPGQGRPRRDHDAQRAAVPDRGGGHPARRPGGGQRQSAVHAARTGAPAQGLGRQGHRHHRELRRHAAACIATTPVKHVVLAAMGDRLGAAEGRAGQLRGAQRQEDGAGLQPARRGALQRRARAGRARHAAASPRSAPTTWPCCSTPAAPPACPRARCCCIAT